MKALRIKTSESGLFIELIKSFQPGVCIGFQVMDKEESPNIPFTVFRQRFPKGKVLFYSQMYLCFTCVLPAKEISISKLFFPYNSLQSIYFMFIHSCFHCLSVSPIGSLSQSL